MTGFASKRMMSNRKPCDGVVPPYKSIIKSMFEIRDTAEVDGETWHTVQVGIVSSSEIKGLFFLPSGRYLPMGLNILQKLWWRFVPGVVINVRWPKGQVKVGPSHRDGYSGYGPEFEYVDSADPNDHYRPWMEHYVGRQGWDWNWGMADRDATDNRLTIKIRQRHAKYATVAAIRWS